MGRPERKSAGSSGPNRVYARRPRGTGQSGVFSPEIFFRTKRSRRWLLFCVFRHGKLAKNEAEISRVSGSFGLETRFFQSNRLLVRRKKSPLQSHVWFVKDYFGKYFSPKDPWLCNSRSAARAVGRFGHRGRFHHRERAERRSRIWVYERKRSGASFMNENAAALPVATRRGGTP